jgi:uncharacterized phage-associated protein
MVSKTKQLLAYIVRNYSQISITSLMKLSYIIDLVHISKTNKQISDFKYIRYTYGPFAYKIYDYLKDLVECGVVIENSNFTPMGEEFIIYEFNNDNEDFSFKDLNKEEIKTVDEVLEKLKGYGARALTELAYRTKPMKKIGAKIGDKTNLNAELDLRAQ